MDRRAVVPSWLPWALICLLVCTNLGTVLWAVARRERDLREFADSWEFVILEGHRLEAWPEWHPLYEEARRIERVNQGFERLEQAYQERVALDE